MTLQDDLYAYTLRSLEAGCAWRIYDVEGVVVASGLERSQKDALAVVSQLITQGGASFKRQVMLEKLL